MAKGTFNKAFVVGLLVALCGGAFLIAYTFFKEGGYSASDSYLVHAYFNDASGLTWKSPAMIAGIQVGEVETVSLSGDRAKLSIRFKKEVKLRTDACLNKKLPS